jgi:hypothetical protein
VWLARLIDSKGRREAAPSVSFEVATALINIRERLGAEAVAVVLDVSEGVLRLGYGVADALGSAAGQRDTARCCSFSISRCEC